MRHPFLTLFSALTVAIVALNTVEARQGTGAALTVSLESGGSAGGGSTPVMLLRDSFEALLKKNGMSLVDWHKACAAESPQCQQAIMQVAQSKAVVAVQAPDASGRVTFARLPPGRYYVFVMREASNGLNVWDVGTDLEQAFSSVELTMRNLVMQNGSRTAVAPAAAAASPPPAAIRSADPSIAKARAAKIDTRVFGIPLGEPLQLRECDALQDFALSPTAARPNTCLNTLSAALQVLGASLLPFGTARENKSNEAMILLGKDSCPIWMATCEVTATVSQGLLLGVTLVTKGPSMDPLIAKELRAKYGAPTFSRVGTVTPDTGKEFTRTNLEWVLPGVHVEYEVVRKVEVESSRVHTNEGQVRIETETAYQQRQKEVKELTKPKL